MNTDTIGNYNMKQGNCPRIWPESRGGGGMSKEQKNLGTVHSNQDMAFLRTEFGLYLWMKSMQARGRS